MKKRILIFLLCALLCTCASAEVAPTPESFNMARRLNELGYCSVTDDPDGDEMRTAISDFQMANGLKATGEADAETLEVMQSAEAVSKQAYLLALSERLNGIGALASGSYGDAVERLQEALTVLGYYDGICDGSYEDSTAEAVVRFQLANGLPETGIADKLVLYRLYEGEPVPWDRFIMDNLASAGDSGDRVRMLQVWLKHMGCFEGECTGEYGEQTQAAVKRYQRSVGLEETGSVDLETGRLLFVDAAKALSAGATVRRGDNGSRALEMCDKLQQLGYNAHDTFDMQTELALMQFQRTNELEVTGEADSATMAAIRLQAQDESLRKPYAPLPVDMLDEYLRKRAEREAFSLIGEAAAFDDSYDFVQYVYMRCGAELPAKPEIPAEKPAGEMNLPLGAPVYVETPAYAGWGIVSENGALIVCGDAGYIVMVYPDMAEIVRTVTAGTIL